MTGSAGFEVQVRPRRVLVLGGTGFVGRAFAAHWTRIMNGASSLRIPSRNPERHRALASLPGVELVRADVHDPNELERLLVGCDAVVNLVAILHGTPAAFEHVHVKLPEILGVACRRAGVSRLVHISALGVPLQDGDPAPSHYLRTKARGERVLRSSGLDCTVLRPSVIFGAEDRFMNLFAGLQRVFPVMPLAGASAQFQPVWVGDVARAIACCLMRPQTAGQIYECAGPDVYRLEDLVRLAGLWAGHPRPVLSLPTWVGRVQAGVLSLLPGEPLMSADNMESMSVPNVASGHHPDLAALNVAPMALSAWIRRPVSGQ